MRKKILKYLSLIFVVLLLLVYFLFILPLWGIPFNAKRHGNPPLTPAWALECWLWEDDVNTAVYVDELLDGYAEHDIPVRTILIDSPWSLHYNDFAVDEERYPDPEKWFKSLSDRQYRVVLWMTSMVNSHSKDTRIPAGGDWFDEATGQGFLIGKNSEIKWWKGTGGFIDYTNQEALTWWQQQQQDCFDWGIDGWKLDGTATLFHKKVGPLPFLYQRSSQGWLSTRQYMDLYYRTEYEHGLSRNPEFVTLARSMDRGYHPEGFAPIDAAPVCWVGDQEHEWLTEELLNEPDEEKVDMALDGVQGFEAAIESILKSAEKGYNVIGSDIGGFSGKTIPPRLYIRWAQFSTFCGLFLNGGHGERALWKRSEQELQIIRKYAWLHTELLPYMYSYVVQGHEGGRVLQSPVKGKYHYLFGDHLLIAPIYKDALENEVQLPPGKWRYWFDDSTLIEGDQKIRRSFPLEEYPVFIRDGAIIPMDIQRSYNSLGDTLSQGYTTWLVYPDKDASSSFTIYSTDEQRPTSLEVAVNDNELNLTFEGEKMPHILRVHLDSPPRSIYLDGSELRDFEYDKSLRQLIIRQKEYQGGKYIIGI
ncbi:MAG: glycoside hydrolase family 31 protein [Saprospiraceae bacterium]|nr:hypothetical protein [Lewinella sp.]